VLGAPKAANAFGRAQWLVRFTPEPTPCRWLPHEALRASRAADLSSIALPRVQAYARVVRHATLKTRRGSRLRMLCEHCQSSFVAAHATA
jgi:hypothetical protein